MDLVDLTTGWLAWLFWPGVVLGTVLALLIIAALLRQSLYSAAWVLSTLSLAAFLFWPFLAGYRCDPSTPECAAIEARYNAQICVILVIFAISVATAILTAVRSKRRNKTGAL